MGNTQGQPQELISFKKLTEDSLLDNVNIPEKEQNRSPTNSKWLIALIASFLIMLPFVIYTLIYSDYRRYFGYDRCGNICGSKNTYYDDIACSGQDMSDLPYLKNGICVNDCGIGYVGIPGINICHLRDRRHARSLEDGEDEFEVSSSNYDSTTFAGFGGTVWQMVVTIIFSLLLALAFLFMFRHAIDMLVWGMIIACILMLGGLICFGWYYYSTIPNDTYENRKTKSNMLVLMGSVSVMGIVYLCMLAWLGKKINLVIKLLKESTKAIFAMPGLIGIPVLAIFAHFVLAAIFAVLYFFMVSAGTLKPNTDPETKYSYEYTYQRNPVMLFTYAYAAFIWIWLSQVIAGINYMTISGAVSKWYFTRNKSYLDAPISTSARITFKFHLGTAAFGGFIITMVIVIKNIILSLIKNEKIKRIVEYCADALEEFFKFLSKNAYIITAMHGQPFLKSGRRAARLIFHNLKSIIAINSIGDFVLGMAIFLIILITLLFFALLMYIFPAGSANSIPIFSYIVVFIVSAVIASVTFGVFETTIDTLFVCYCEDSLMNDGMARPYFMSRELMEFIEGSRKAYDKKGDQV